MIRAPIPTGNDWKTWARQLNGFLGQSIPNLSHKTGDETAAQNGTVLWDEENGYPVVSSGGAFLIVAIVAGTYADNAAAISGGLTAGQVYKTATGELRIVV
jgi:hypothetical protein